MRRTVLATLTACLLAATLMSPPLAPPLQAQGNKPAPPPLKLKVGDEAQLAWPGLGPVQMDFVKAGGVTLAAVELPDSSYPETDFASAFFNMSVNLGLTASECEQLTPQASSGEAPAAKVKLGGIEFYEKENVNQEELKQADTRYYHSFQNGMCYEFALGVGTARDGADDQTPQVDRTEVFRKLEKILATVQIKSVAVPAPAAPVNSQESTGAILPGFLIFPFGRGLPLLGLRDRRCGGAQSRACPKVACLWPEQAQALPCRS